MRGPGPAPGAVAGRTFPGLLLLSAAAAVLLAGCLSVGSRPLPYDPQRHGTAQEEWPPHRGVAEWWYFTAVLEAEQGPLFLAQFTIFHLETGAAPVWMLHLAATDYGARRHLFEESLTFDPFTAHGEQQRIVYGDSSIELLPDSLLVRGSGRDLSFDLAVTGAGPAVWHGRKGVISMGHPADPRQNSFYYSFPSLESAGWLAMREPGGAMVTRQMTGMSWLDRQWGRFREKGWDWFSLRFFDGDRIMLFSFPATGYRDGTWVSREGKVTTFDDFDYLIQRWVRRGEQRYGLGWRLELPVKAGRYRVEPMYQGDFNPNMANDYWEGLCRLLDDSGRPVGYCVTETTWEAHTREAAASE